jgi:hypothetical protein
MIKATLNSKVFKLSKLAHTIENVINPSYAAQIVTRITRMIEAIDKPTQLNHED